MKVIKFSQQQRGLNLLTLFTMWFFIDYYIENEIVYGALCTFLGLIFITNAYTVWQQEPVEIDIDKLI